MGFAISAVLGVWAILLSLGYLCQSVLRLRPVLSLAALVAAYLMLAAVALAVLGLNVRGLLGVTGMSVPLVAACGLVVLGGRTRR